MHGGELMTSRDFCYWLQGLFELGSPKAMDETQTALIRAHLAMVFKHEIDPSMGTSEHQDELREIHEQLDAVDAKIVDAKEELRREHRASDPNRRIMC